jgi:tripartite-type tricarboxylate transporter receptor subunit TctC
VIRIATIAIVFALAASQVWAQSNYPVKPIRWIVPYAAGGGVDIVVRPIALKLGEVLGQPIVYENRAGAGGLIAGELVARSAPDGYTLLVGASNTQIFATLLNDKIPYDPVKDYAPITNFATVPNMLVARPSFPAKTIQELVTYAKANPGKINFASSGNGAAGHLGLVLFCDRTGITVTHVPYKGAGPATAAVLGGESDLLLSNVSNFLTHLKAGRLRALGIASEKRVAVLPDVPTFAESGVPGVISGSFYGLLAPAGTPRAIIQRLYAESAKVVRSPESVTRLESVGAVPVASTPEALRDYLRKEVETWGRIIKQHGIKAS